MKPTFTLLTALLLAPPTPPGADESLQREGRTDGMTALGTDFPKAVHAEVTKFHGWFYNFSTCCPQDRRGRTAGDVWAESYARIF